MVPVSDFPVGTFGVIAVAVLTLLLVVPISVVLPCVGAVSTISVRQRAGLEVEPSSTSSEGRLLLIVALSAANAVASANAAAAPTLII